MSHGRRPALVAIVWLGCAATAAAHEPVHGLGPNTLWRGGTAVELEFGADFAETLRHGGHRERDGAHGGERELEVGLHVAHGLTADLLVFGELPLAAAWERSGGVTERATGFADAAVGGKWRFWRAQVPAEAHAAAGILKVNLPTGRQSSDPRLGNGRPSVDLALTAARDTIDSYLWGDLRLRLPIPGGRRLAAPGVGADVAAGWRVWEPAYRGADLVLLCELNAWAQTRTRTRGHADRGTAAAMLALGPGLLFFYDRFEAKLGVQVPLWRWTEGRGRLPDIGVAGGIGIVF